MSLVCIYEQGHAALNCSFLDCLTTFSVVQIVVVERQDD